MRRSFTALHRWLGLFTAGFLFVAGLTGAIIAWDHELDALLNPHFYHATGAAPVTAARALALADGLEDQNPRLHVRYLPLGSEPGHTLHMFAGPNQDPRTGELYELEHDQFALHPETGLVQGKRRWGALSLSRENLLPFLYKLHYTMHLPDGFGVSLGILFMGIVAVIWLFDSFVALVLAFPSRKTWRKSFAFRLRAGSVKLIFDLHRSGGVWVFGLLLMLAFTAVSMNLGDQVVRPLVSLVSPLRERPYDRALREAAQPGEEVVITRAEALALATQEARSLGITQPAGGMFHADEAQAYGVGFFAPGKDHGDGGLGNPWIYVSARDGHVLGAEIPGRGSAGDIFMQAQFPLHSGRIFGVAGRALMSFMGLVVAMLSATGILIWARKRRARREARSVDEPAALPAEHTLVSPS